MTFKKLKPVLRFRHCLVAATFCGLILTIGPVVYAQSNAVPHDMGQPVEILADSLEVQENEQVAIFAGNVEATQGQLKLNTARLVVHYSAGGQASVASNEIEKLEAKGGVVMSRPGEEATGDWAIYDVTGRLITLGGDVVLTRQGNVVRGERLTLDLDSGVSRIEGGTQVSGQGESSGRVRSLFTPADKEP